MGCGGGAMTGLHDPYRSLVMAGLAPILLVEDNQDDVDLALRAFRQSQFANPIAVAYDGVDALDYLFCMGAYALRPPILPAAILLDIHMPRLDGIEVLRTVKSDELLSMIPIIMLTSAPTDPNLAECYALGANAYVVKPVGPAGFLDVIRSIGLFWMVVNRTPELATDDY